MMDKEFNLLVSDQLVDWSNDLAELYQRLLDRSPHSGGHRRRIIGVPSYKEYYSEAFGDVTVNLCKPLLEKELV